MSSGEKEVLMDIDKYIKLKLWYTALTISKQIHINYSLVDRITNYLNELINLLLRVESPIKSDITEDCQWILHILLKKINGNRHVNLIKQNIHEHFKKLQFLYTLKLIDSNALDKAIQEELLTLLVLNSETNKISELCLNFLYHGFKSNPALTCKIVNVLYYIGINSWSNKGNLNCLQNLYEDVLKELIRNEPPMKDTYINDKHHNYPLEKEENINDSTLGVILCILSAMPTNEDFEDCSLKWLCPLLLKICNIQDIEFALYSRKSNKFLHEYHRLTVKDLQANAKENENQRNILNISVPHYVNSKNILLHMVCKKSHWFLNNLEVCQTYMAKDDRDAVMSIMSCYLFKDMWPTLLMKFFLEYPQKQFNTVDAWWEENNAVHQSLSFLLDKSNVTVEDENSVLYNVYITFESHLRVVKWILNNRKVGYLTAKEIREGGATASQQTAVSTKYILVLLQNFGTLSVLKKTTDIHAAKYDEIKDVLKKALTNSLSNSSNVLEAYFAMLNALRAILSADRSDNDVTKNQHIEKCLSDMVLYLKNTYPLQLRLEAIENIFSLFFLRYEDFHNDFEDVEQTLSESELRNEYRSKRQHGQEIGFICNEHVIKRIIHHLEDSILATNAEYSKCKLQPSSPVENLDELKTRISALTRALADAKWRLDLFADLNIPNTLGSIDIPILETDLSDYSGRTLSFEGNAVSDDIENTRLNNCTGRRRKHSRSKALATATAATVGGNDQRNHDLVNYMLASKESFVVRCLWNNDYAKAEQLIEMLDEKKGLKLSGEVQFSKALQNFRRDMSKGELAEYSETTKSFEKKATSSPLVETIRIAAQEGVQSFRHANQLETFLASQSRYLTHTAIDLNDPKPLHDNEIITLCVLDLALTTGQMYRLSCNICDVALKYLKVHGAFDGEKIGADIDNATLADHERFFLKIYALLHENKNEAPITDILCDMRIPLSTNEVKKRNNFWMTCAHELREYRSFNKHTNDDFSTKDKPFKSNDRLLAPAVIRKIIGICSESNEKYLQNIHAHLQLLCTMMPGSLDESTTTIVKPTTISDSLKISLHSYFAYQIFDLLIEPDQLEEIANKLRVNIVYVIFINAYPKLFCRNYMKTVVAIDTSSIKCRQRRAVLNDVNHFEDILQTVSPVQNPNQCIAEILMELLNILRLSLKDEKTDDNDEDHRYEREPVDVINYSKVEELAKSADLRFVLSKTARLANLDLGELSVGNETLTFFLNTWNVMFLHAFLVCWSNKPPFGGLRRDISLSSIGYIIGDLGFVTLIALRSKLLGSSLANAVCWDRKCFTEQQLDEELNEPAWQDLDLTQDPRVIFAMANEFYGTPMIRVYEASKLNEQLNEAERDYLNYYSLIVNADNNDTTNEKQILFPDIVRRVHDFKDHPFSINTYINAIHENVTVHYLPHNYAYQIVLKYRPKISNDIMGELKEEDTSLSSFRTHKIHSSLLRYLEGHCWLLSYFAQRQIHDCDESNHSMGEKNDSASLCSQSTNRTIYLENLLNSSWVEKLCAFVDNSKVLAAICENHIPKTKLWDFFEEQLKQGNWENCLNTTNALSNDFVERNIEILYFRDIVLRYWIREATKGLIPSTSEEILQYLYRIKNIYILAQTILENVKLLPTEVCENALHHVTYHINNNKLPMHCRLRIEDVSKKVTIFRKMLPYLNDSQIIDETASTMWYEVAYSVSNTAVDNGSSRAIIASLINAGKCELCLEWLECQTFPLEVQSLINEEFLIGLLKKDSQGFVHALKLLGALPPGRSVQMCKNVLKNVESIDSLEFIVTYLIEHCRTPTQTTKYRKTLIGIGLLKNLEVKERPHYIHLIKEPILMLEQLLMNCKFENIQKILHAMECEPCAAGENGAVIWASIRTSFDETIRFYAKKSLDFRVSLPHRTDVTSETKQKAKTVVTEDDNGEFVMPVTVPTKEEWVPNDKARECSCCKVVIFSMFNRRHHCRRCGRVVCAVCSQHRAIVSGYPNTVLVRVCNDCKRQMADAASQTRSTTASTAANSEVDYWKLTKNEAYDRMIREDFSFEYAPNITLCLAILNLHSDHKAYTSFLLDRCDEMKRLLQPVEYGKINPEIDHAVIIKMMRSLLIAAKVKCAKLGFNSGLVHCDRFLSQVDLITTLVRSDLGLTLVPSTNNLDEHARRKLRDLFIDEEQWTVALDISTKAGLETQGVWATWGKACLKVGYFERAREKFSHCLGKITEEYVDDWVILSHSQEKDSYTAAGSTGTTKKNEILKSRPTKDPSLLTEILQILENLRINECRVTQQTTTLGFQSIPFRNETSASPTNLIASPSINSRNQKALNYYQESLYYLLTYGSFNSILDFFLKHDEYDKCLAYVLENHLDPEIFFNAVYWYCMKNGNVEKLQEFMRLKDPSLLSWKKYLVYICRNLEKKEYLHSLYQLQLFMKDYVRATMTCIRFYTNDANTYNDLCSRKHLLLNAQKHLESELVAQSHDVNVGNKVSNSSSKRRKSTITHGDGGVHQNQNLPSAANTSGRFIMAMDVSEIDKHINTICRQMEIAKFLGNGEKEGRNSVEILRKLISMDCEFGLNTSQVCTNSNIELPTLFGDQRQKTYLAVLAILCGRNVEEGFGIAFRIMQDYNLRSQKVYSLAGHMLALRNDVGAIEQLVKCCRSSGAPSAIVISDYVLTHCVKLLLERSHVDSTKPIVPKDHIDPLIRLIMDVELKISAYIESRQLKAAYLLAVKYSKAQDIRRILREADKLGQSAIKAICTKWLQQQSSKS